MSQSNHSLPARLRPGDTVAVCAPSGPVDEARLLRSLPILEERYSVRMPEGVLARDGFLAGSDERRAAELNGLLADPDVRAIVFARGGYGAARILPLLDAAALRADPIPLVGFSDNTALLGWAQASAGVGSIHGPVAAQLAELDEVDVEWLFAMLERAEPAGELPGAFAPLGAGPAFEGHLWGGNLSIVAHSIATPHWPAARDAVFFLEEVGERPYAIDRYLTRLAAAGALDEVYGVIVGDLVRCHETIASDHPSAAEVVGERLAAVGLTGVSRAPFGHGKRNLALPFGGRVGVDPGAGTVELLTSAVA